MKSSLRDKYPLFIYKNYVITETKETYEVVYTYELGEYVFNPKIKVSKTNITNKNINKDFLKNLFFNYGMLDLINYYKLACSKEIIVECGYLNNEQKEFYKKLMYNGLSEYLHINNFDLSYKEFLSINTSGKKIDFIIEETFEGNLIPIGGGKDSIVTLELLKEYKSNNLCFILNRNIYPKNEAGYNSIYTAGYTDEQLVLFEVTLDPLMLKLSKEMLNGHVPISSNIALSGYIMAYLNNKKYVVLSNEASANETNIVNTNINHQYSKSFEFEADFRNYCDKYFTDKIKYFSLLRCWNEFKIIKQFIKNKKYLQVFRSCNRGTKTNSWCSDCAKCLYVYIMLSPFISLEELDQIFNKRLLEQSEYIPLLDQLINPDNIKPFECVGEREEISYALSLTLNKYDSLPTLLQYYKNNYYKNSKEFNIENYFNNNNLIPKEYKRLVKNAKK